MFRCFFIDFHDNYYFSEFCEILQRTVVFCSFRGDFIVLHPLKNVKRFRTRICASLSLVEPFNLETAEIAEENSV